MGDKTEAISPTLAAKRAGPQVSAELLQKLREAGLLAPGNAGEIEAKAKEAGLLAPPAPPPGESKSYRYLVTKKTWREEAKRFCEPGEEYVASAPHFSSALEPADEETRIATEGEKKRLDAHRKKHEKPKEGAVDIDAIVQATVAALRAKDKADAADAVDPAGNPGIAPAVPSDKTTEPKGKADKKSDAKN